MRTLIAAFVISLFAMPAFTSAAEDPPSRVARLSHIEGEVSMAPAGTQEWGEAVLNRPLTSEDRLFVDRDARAELQIGSATVHLDAETEFSFIDLDDDAMTMNLAEGRATIRIVRKRDSETIEVSTPNASVSLDRPGEYTIEVNDEGETTVVKSRSGEAEVADEGKSYTVRADEVGVFRGSAELSADINKLGPRTAFENWANDRARRDERSASSRYVGEGVIGYEDLDDHGDWVSEPEYGYVWRPRYVVAGWAPYRHGRWAWISPWGWTWIDDARWGFAPFHYGRWAYVSHRWCWVPGPRHVRAVYAPALVAWTSRPGVNVSVSIGSGIGWFPLGPREVYVPGYWHTRRYIHNVNVSNTIIVNNTYINNAYRGRYRDFDYRYRGRPDAVTVVEREHFVHGRPVNGRSMRVDDRDLRRWTPNARPPAIAPDRESVLASQRRTPRSWDQSRANRQIVARRELPSRVSFDAERQAIEANGGRPVARTQLVDRNPKDRGNVRVARSFDRSRPDAAASRAGAVGRTDDGKFARRSSRDADAAREATANGNDARENAINRRTEIRERAERQRDANAENVQRMEAAENNSRGERLRSDEGRGGGSGPAIEARRERQSSDWAQQRAEQRQREQVQRQEQSRFESRRQEQSRAVDAQRQEQSRAFEAQREAAREAQRSQRESWSRQRNEGMERRSEPRQQPQIERSAPQPRMERMERSAPQPRIERSAPQPRAAEPKQRGNASNHMRSERGSRER